MFRLLQVWRSRREKLRNSMAHRHCSVLHIINFSMILSFSSTCFWALLVSLFPFTPRCNYAVSPASAWCCFVCADVISVPLEQPRFVLAAFPVSLRLFIVFRFIGSFCIAFGTHSSCLGMWCCVFVHDTMGVYFLYPLSCALFTFREEVQPPWKKLQLP